MRLSLFLGLIIVLVIVNILLNIRYYIEFLTELNKILRNRIRIEQCFVYKIKRQIIDIDKMFDMADVQTSA